MTQLVTDRQSRRFQTMTKAQHPDTKDVGVGIISYSFYSIPLQSTTNGSDPTAVSGLIQRQRSMRMIDP